MDRKVILTLRHFRKALEANGIKVKKMIVFGSHARGNAATYSDIDVVVISNDFRRLNLLRRLEFLGSVFAKAKIMAPIDALGCTEKEAKRLTPDELLQLVDELIHELLTKRRGKNSRLDWKGLYGLGKGLWKNEDAQTYIAHLRKDR